MATHISTALQTKIFQLLTGDATLTTLLGGANRVFDHTPDNQVYPYVQVGDDAFDDFGSHDIDGFKVAMTIHTWTQGEGRKSCKQIQDRIYALLHDTDLALSGQKTVSLRAGSSNTMLDPDGRTHHGVSIFNLILGG